MPDMGNLLNKGLWLRGSSSLVGCFAQPWFVSTKLQTYVSSLSNEVLISISSFHKRLYLHISFFFRIISNSSSRLSFRSFLALSSLVGASFLSCLETGNYTIFVKNVC